jgi:hypothetical protein
MCADRHQDFEYQHGYGNARFEPFNGGIDARASKQK